MKWSIANVRSFKEYVKGSRSTQYFQKKVLRGGSYNLYSILLLYIFVYDSELSKMDNVKHVRNILSSSLFSKTNLFPSCWKVHLSGAEFIIFFVYPLYPSISAHPIFFYQPLPRENWPFRNLKDSDTSTTIKRKLTFSKP